MAEFSDEWQAALDEHPRLDYFKASEAMTFNDQFQSFTSRQRDLRLELLVSIIKHHAQVGIVTVIPTDHFRRIIVGCTGASFIDRPYFHLIHSLMGHFVTYASKEQLTDPIDFIFDTQDDEPEVMEEIRMGFNFFVQAAPNEVRSYFGDPPIFCNSKRTLPLQAADLLAWRARRTYFEIAGNSKLTEYPIHERLFGIPHLLDFWSEEKLRTVAAGMKRAVIEGA
jgi:hypothetical protein